MTVLMPLLLVMLGACDREAPTPPPSLALPPVPTTPGGVLFYARSLGGLPGCQACHAVQRPGVPLAPSILELREQAAGRIPGMGARAYVLQSIVDPGAHVVDGYPDVMPRAYTDVLGSRQIGQLVEFMLGEDAVGASAER